MENKNIIIILVAIVIVLAVIAGAMFLQSGNAKEPTKVKITSDKEQYEDGEISIKLTDLNKTPVSKQIVNVTITDKKGKVVVDDSVKTNSKGKAKLDLDLKKGKYEVNVTYNGNENYTGNNTTQKLTIKKAATETTNDKSSVDMSNFPSYNPSIGNYRVIQQHDELCLIETSNGEYYVLAGDGYYNYDGLDSKGYIKLGSYVGKY